MIRCLFVTFCLVATTSLANIAQPGVWSSGGTGTFSLLYPEDATAYKKIQMKQELVLVQLYRGFATVKGTYWMYNGESQPITLNVGYPMSGDFEAEQGIKMTVHFDSLYRISAKINGRQAPINSTQANWYVWQTTFAPQAVTKIEVYFLVNTNQSELIKGYDHLNNPIFTYVLQTGSIWKNPIEQGAILVHFNDGLKLTDIKGAQPDTALLSNIDKNLLLYRFNNLVPSPNNNFFLVYSEKNENFDFKNIIAKADDYFDELDALPAKWGFSLDDFPDSWLKNTSFQQAEVASYQKMSSGIPVGWQIGFGVIVAVGLLIMGLVIWLIVKLVRRSSR